MMMGKNTVISILALLLVALASYFAIFYMRTRNRTLVGNEEHTSWDEPKYHHDFEWCKNLLTNTDLSDAINDHYPYFYSNSFVGHIDTCNIFFSDLDPNSEEAFPVPYSEIILLIEICRKEDTRCSATEHVNSWIEKEGLSQDQRTSLSVGVESAASPLSGTALLALSDQILLTIDIRHSHPQALTGELFPWYKRQFESIAQMVDARLPEELKMEE